MALYRKGRVPKSLFREVMTKGKGATTPLFNTTIFFPVPNLIKPAISVVVSSKVAKMAVERNKIKRQIRGVFYDLRSRIKPSSVILVFTKPQIKGASPRTVREALISSLERSGILQV